MHCTPFTHNLHIKTSHKITHKLPSPKGDSQHTTSIRTKTQKCNRGTNETHCPLLTLPTMSTSHMQKAIPMDTNKVHHPSNLSHTKNTPRNMTPTLQTPATNPHCNPTHSFPPTRQSPPNPNTTTNHHKLKINTNTQDAKPIQRANYKPLTTPIPTDAETKTNLDKPKKNNQMS